MNFFNIRFYAIFAFVMSIISLAITISVANAQKAKISKDGKKVYQVSPLKSRARQDMPSAQKALNSGKKPRCLRVVSAEFAATSGKPHKMNAIRAWREKVATRHGKKYSHWSISQKHNVQCSGSPRQKKCIASAVPCRVIQWNATRG